MSKRATIYRFKEERLQEIFRVFDRNEDGFIDKEEFVLVFERWIHPVRYE